ncbi:MAG TPA: zinc ribbon domain-containing protein [Anaerolineales bacterium]|nr:zinc ribbon domain-containing protein [Anaerolineales bacterium]
MDWMALLLVAGMAVLAAAYIARPLIVGEAHEPGARERRLSTLYAERDQVLSLISELDVDYTLGKILPEDYQAQRAEYVRRGADLLRSIDELAPTAEAGLRAGSDQDSLEARIAQLRARAAGFCAKCGNPLVLGDRFCSSCGQPVPEVRA